MNESCQKVDGGDDDSDGEGCCMGETERKMNMCSNSPSMNNCNNMNGCYWQEGDCSMPTPPPGCCYAADPMNKKASQCYDVDYDTCALLPVAAVHVVAVAHRRRVGAHVHLALRLAHAAAR